MLLYFIVIVITNNLICSADESQKNVQDAKSINPRENIINLNSDSVTNCDLFFHYEFTLFCPHFCTELADCRKIGKKRIMIQK